ncbi:MAG: hypothetical protein HY526_05095 [Betaproteobacteria bacterium]|nr:hypothetical protein [Betaproteobacteria bacterium]
MKSFAKGPGGIALLVFACVAAAAQAPPDGYTLLGASETLMLNGIFKRAAYDVRKTFVPIVKMTSQPYVLVVTPALPVKSVKELIAYGKARFERDYDEMEKVVRAAKISIK